MSTCNSPALVCPVVCLLVCPLDCLLVCRLACPLAGPLLCPPARGGSIGVCLGPLPSGPGGPASASRSGG
eukprot:5001250-Alexandrium_andersonii.AAC.1